MKKPVKPVEKMQPDASLTARLMQYLKTFWPEFTEAQRLVNSPYFDERQYFAEIETFVTESEGQGNSMNEIDQVTFKGTLSKFVAVAEAILTEWDALITNFEMWTAARAEGKSERIQKLKTGVRLAEDVSGPEVITQAKLLYYRPIEHAQRYGNYGKVVATHLPEDQTCLRVYADPEYLDEMAKQWDRLNEVLAAQGWTVPPVVAAQEASRKAGEQRMKEWGETPFTAFHRIIVSSCDDLYGDRQGKVGVIRNWLSDYRRDHPSKYDLSFERMGYIASITVDGYYPVISMEASEDTTAGNVDLRVEVDGNSVDIPYHHDLYKVAREVGQALRDYLERRYPVSTGGAAQPDADAAPPAETSAIDWSALPGTVTLNIKGDPVAPKKGEPKDNFMKYCVICQERGIDYAGVLKDSRYSTLESLRTAIGNWKTTNGLPKQQRGRKPDD